MQWDVTKTCFQQECEFLNEERFIQAKAQINEIYKKEYILG